MSHDHPSSNRRRLGAALAIVVVFLGVEIVGAVLSGSLALLADAGHMASDAVGLLVALIASAIAARPASDRHTFGFRRFEVIAALINGVILTVVAVTVAVQGIARLFRPEHVSPVPVIIVAVAALVSNIVAFAILRGGDRTSINLRGAYLEVLGDLVGSLAALAAGVVILTTGWLRADALASLFIAVFIVPRAIILLRDVVRVLTESAPADTDVAKIRQHILDTAGVVAVHDVHVWAITSGAPVFSAHVVVEASVFSRGETGALLDTLGDCLAEHFDVEHSTFQLEPAEHAAHEEPHHR